MAEQINSGQIVQKPDIVISPLFPLPPGITGVTQATESSVDFADLEEEDENLDTTGDGRLAAPTSVTVISQDLKYVGGVALVDVVVDVLEVPGVTDYEVRVTKV